MRVLFTIGHSTRSEAEFLHLLNAYDIQVLADVRRYPGSKRNPQFGSDLLKSRLSQQGIRYLHFPELGGRRRARKDSRNLGWEVAAFRGYADYMETEEFQRSLQRLLTLATRARVAIMCSEAVPWRCHRRLIADAATAKGAVVFDIMTANSAPRHELPPWAEVRSGHLSYPDSQKTLRRAG